MRGSTVDAVAADGCSSPTNSQGCLHVITRRRLLVRLETLDIHHGYAAEAAEHTLDTLGLLLMHAWPTSAPSLPPGVTWQWLSGWRTTPMMS